MIKSDNNLRKIHRDFEGKVNLVNNTSIEILDQMFREYYNESIALFINTEKKNHPNSSEKEILIKLYSLSEKLKGRKSKN